MASWQFTCQDAMVKALDLKEGDDINIDIANARTIHAAHTLAREDALA